MLLKTREEFYRPRHFGFVNEIDLLHRAGRERAVIARKLATGAGRALRRWSRKLGTMFRRRARIDLSGDELSRLDDRMLVDIRLKRSDLFIASRRTPNRRPVNVDRPAQGNDISSQAA